MAFDPIQEDCLRLILANMEREAFSSSKTPCTSIVPPRRSKTTPRRSSTPIVSARFTWYPRQRRSSTTVRRSHRPNRTPRRSSTLRRTTCASDRARPAQLGCPAHARHPAIGIGRRTHLLSARPSRRCRTRRRAPPRGRIEPLRRGVRARFGAAALQRWIAMLASRLFIAGQYRMALMCAEEGLRAYPLDMAGIRHTGMLALAKLEVAPEELKRYRSRHAAAYQLAGKSASRRTQPGGTHRTRGALSRR
mgnify:CR=1 FL=1